MFAGTDQTVLWVGVANIMKDAWQGTPKLHGLRRSVRCHGVIDGRPAPVPGVVTEQAWFSFVFLLYGSRREHEIE